MHKSYFILVSLVLSYKSGNSCLLLTFISVFYQKKFGELENYVYLCT